MGQAVRQLTTQSFPKHWTVSIAAGKAVSTVEDTVNSIDVHVCQISTHSVMPKRWEHTKIETRLVRGPTRRDLISGTA